MRPEHAVQLFDAAETRADAVAAFLLEGEARGEHAIVGLTPHHWQLVADRLTHAGYPLDARLAEGRLQIVEAADLLGRIERNGRIEPALFEAHAASAVRRLSASGHSLRLCGELVDLLAQRGELRTAVALEQLWCSLQREIPFTLFCLYWSVHFGHARSQDALRQICRVHTEVRSDPADPLGEWLLRDQVRAFGPA